MGHTQVVKVLLDYKASIDIQDSDGCTALHKAASQVRKEEQIWIEKFFFPNRIVMTGTCWNDKATHIVAG